VRSARSEKENAHQMLHERDITDVREE